MASGDLKLTIRVVTEKDLLKEEIACLRLLKAIAEQERDDAQADAAAYRAERDAVNAANRRLRLKANEDDTFLRAARHIGKETEKELDELRALIQAMRGWENASTDTEIELRSRIDVYQCEVEGLKAALALARRSDPSIDNSLSALAGLFRAGDNT